MKVAFSFFLKKGAICALATFVLSWTPLAAKEPSPEAVQVEPSKIKVLLLPALDEASGAAGRSRLREQIIRLRQQYLFISRHFVVLGEEMAVQATGKKPILKIESSRERSAEVLDELAVRAGADWVVSLAMQTAGYDEDPAFDGTHFTARTTVKLQVRDARAHRWLANETHTRCTTSGGAPPEILLACTWNVVDEALSPLLSSYPEVVPVSLDGAIVDYLKGQTKPFVGEPGQEFRGLIPPLP